MIEEIGHPKPMSKIFPNGAAMRAFSAQALQQLAPPDGQLKTLVFEGQGTEIYEAEPSADTKDKLAWRLRGSTADLVEIKTDFPEKENTPAARVRLSQGFVWSASDGSSMVGQIEKIALAPESTDAPWVLF
jgi:hypothetical protein